MSDEVDSTPVAEPAGEQQPQSVRESIVAALNNREIDEVDVSEEANEEVEELPEAPIAAASDDEADEPDADNSDDEVEGEADEPADLVAAPEHWSAEFKEGFESLPDEGRQMFLDRYKDMERDYTRKTQEIADIRRRAASIEEVITPFRDEFSRAGMDDAGAVRQLLGAHKFLRESPQQAIAWLAQNYGVDINGLGATEQPEDDYTDPQVVQLRDQVSQLQGYLQNQQNQQQQARVVDTQQTIDTFANATTDDGAVAHPHFAAVRTTMGGLIQSGVATDMNAAYEMAVYADPELRSSLIDLQADKVQAKAKQAANVRKAKRAQRSNVKSSGVPATEALPANGSVRDAILHAMRDSNIST